MISDSSVNSLTPPLITEQVVIDESPQSHSVDSNVYQVTTQSTSQGGYTAPSIDVPTYSEKLVYPAAPNYLSDTFNIQQPIYSLNPSVSKSIHLSKPISLSDSHTLQRPIPFTDSAFPKRDAISVDSSIYEKPTSTSNSGVPAKLSAFVDSASSQSNNFTPKPTLLSAIDFTPKETLDSSNSSFFQKVLPSNKPIIAQDFSSPSQNYTTARTTMPSDSLEKEESSEELLYDIDVRMGDEH